MSKDSECDSFKVVHVPVLDDNYAYIVVDLASSRCALVDAVEPAKVLERVKELDCTVSLVLTTHHHWDHAGGNKELLSLLADESVRVYGEQRVQAVTNVVSDGDRIQFESLCIHVHVTPCHTSGHALFRVASPLADEADALFTGDTLFVGGCGKFFEGDGRQMNAALNAVIAKLDRRTQIWCGHEYTVSNLRFARSVEPSNKALLAKSKWADEQRKLGLPTIPSSVAGELAFNPFMRLESAELRASISVDASTSDDDVMSKLRAAKNSFRQ
jgi:hydroxyacylglutathione hydrolase